LGQPPSFPEGNGSAALCCVLISQAVDHYLHQFLTFRAYSCMNNATHDAYKNLAEELERLLNSC